MIESSDSSQKEHITMLCQKIIVGDTQAENEFVTLHYRWLLFVVRKKFNGTDLHMDIVQDAFVLVIAKLKSQEVKQHHTIRAYLRTCAINIGYEYLRKNKKYASAIDQDYLSGLKDDQLDILDQLEWQEGIDHVKQVIDELPTPRDRQILNQFYFEEQSKTDICDQFELKPAHFDRVIFRAKQRLKALIEAKSGRNDDFPSPDKQANRDNIKMNYPKTNKKGLLKVFDTFTTQWGSWVWMLQKRCCS